MTGRILGTVLLAVALLSGCAGLNRPRTFAYPVQGQDPSQQSRDYAACEAWARNQTGYDAAGAAVTGGVTGVVVGATIGAIFGAILCAPIRAAGECAALGAAIGGATGGMRLAAANVDARRAEFTRAFQTCALAKGYSTGGLVIISTPAPAPPPPPPPPPPAMAPDPLAENTEIAL